MKRYQPSFNDIDTTERLLLSTVTSAVLIEQQFGTFLLPAPEGVYKQGEVDACIVSGYPYFYEAENVKYFTEKGLPASVGKSMQPIININDIKTNVYDNSGIMVIPAFMMQDKQRYLSSTPTVPYRGVILAELLIRNYLDSISSIPGKRSYAGRIERHVDPRYINSDVIDNLEVICKTLFLQIEQFVGDDLWHIYYVKRIQFDIVIDKTIDYRIHCYNTQNNQQESHDDPS